MNIQSKKNEGFTLVELIIVIVVIGILAAIILVAYSGITGQANDTAVRSDLTNIAKGLDVYKVYNNSYPADATQLGEAKFKATHGSYLDRNNLYYCVSNDHQHYAIGVWVKTKTRYWMKDGSVTETTDDVNGGSTCNQLGSYAHPTTVTAYGLHHNTTTGTSTWQSWTE